MIAAQLTAESAHRIMAEHPSENGWQRLESRSCRGRHPRTPGQGPQVYWRRRRDFVDLNADPALWVVEQVSSAICVQSSFYRTITILQESPFAAELTPWLIRGPLAPGSRVYLTVANGNWVWQLTDDRSCCGGYLARWPD